MSDNNIISYFKSVNNQFKVENEKERKFLRNGVKLKDINYDNNEQTDNNDVVDEFRFKQAIQQEVNQIINVKYNNIVVLAGAGASVVMNNEKIDKKYGKTMKIIGNQVIKELRNDTEDYYSICKFAELSKYKREIPNSSHESNESEHKQCENEFDLEKFLSNAYHFQAYVDTDKQKYDNTLNKILKIIKKNTNYQYDRNVMKHGSLLNILNKHILSPSKLSIVTTNYDTMFEDAANQNNFVVFDGFSFGADSFFDSSMFDWNLVREVPNVNTHQVEYKDKVINLIKLHGSLTWKRCKGKIYRKSKNEIRDPQDTVMIFPSSDKYEQSYQEPYFELFSKFQELLKRPNTLLITTGFSFSDNHIAKMVIQAINNNAGLTTMITDYDIDQNNNNWHELEKLMDSHHPVYFLKATLNDDLTDYLGNKYEN